MLKSHVFEALSSRRPQSVALLRRAFVMMCLIISLNAGLSAPALAVEYDLQDNAVLHARNGQLLMERGQTEEAIEEFKAAIRLNPYASMAAPIYKNLAEAYIEAGQFAAAETAFLSMAEANPENEEAWFMLGLLYREQGNRTASKACFKRFLKLQPESEMAQAARAALK